jgi:K+ transporter
MEPPRIEPIVQACEAHGLLIDDDETSFFYAHPTLECAPTGALPEWQRRLFGVLQRNSRPLPDDLEIRAERRIELAVPVGV